MILVELLKDQETNGGTRFLSGERLEVYRQQNGKIYLRDPANQQRKLLYHRLEDFPMFVLWKLVTEAS